MTENEISAIILDASIKIHQNIGPGLLESAYESMLYYELKTKRGLNVQRQVDVPLYYDGVLMDTAYRADLIVENKVLIELKSVEAFAKVHFKQTLTYIRLKDLKLGLLINFSDETLVAGYKRIVNDL
jgi:GxxExxY protein